MYILFGAWLTLASYPGPFPAFFAGRYEAKLTCDVIEGTHCTIPIEMLEFVFHTIMVQCITKGEISKELESLQNCRNKL